MTGGPTVLPSAASASTDVKSRQGSPGFVGEEGRASSEGDVVPGAKVGIAADKEVAAVDEDAAGAELDDGVDGLPPHPTITKMTVAASAIGPSNCFMSISY